MTTPTRPRGARRLTPTALSRGRKPRRYGSREMISRGSFTRIVVVAVMTAPHRTPGPSPAAAPPVCGATDGSQAWGRVARG
ncbi:hypothetical protein CPE01_03920 [Cellulomonas persica]|uniref:Uncharacterized protein n=1 Tax=Cellulomonas persica TaxID=76861 RepID=A0A510UQ11_9CELL|nr:hypothetical protein CPE01_03920 [Cellulomonas persica]